MTEVLPEFPDLNQLRRQAKDLYRAALAGEPIAVFDLSGVSSRVDLSSAQLVIARRYGLSSWPQLKVEVERKNLIHRGEVDGLRRLLAKQPRLVSAPVSSCFTNDGPLGYIGVARFHGLIEHDRSDELAHAFLTAGCSPNGPDETPEPPLITAASYGEVEMVRAIIDAGANLEATGFAVPQGTALAHAIAFGNTEVVDLLAGAGAVVHDLFEAAGVGILGGYDLANIPVAARARAAKAAAVCERLDILERLLVSGVPVDADPDTGSEVGSKTLLHEAAYWGKARSVRMLLTMGADPNSRDTEFQSTPLGWCRHRHSEIAEFAGYLTVGHRRVERILEPITSRE